MHYRPRQQTAQMIYDWLRSNGDDTSWGVRVGTGLSHRQFWYGMGYLRDVLEAQYGTPLIWSPSRGVYSLTMSEDEWMAYLTDWRLRSMYTQAKRTEQCALAGASMFGTRKKATRRTVAGITAVRQMIESLV